jgi:hypothetical protein
MKKLVNKVWIFSICIFCTQVSAQSLDWAHKFGGVFQDYAKSVVVDNDGNVYVAGEFVDTVDFDPGPGISVLIAISNSGYVAKFDKNGNFIWVQQKSGSNWQKFTSVKLDSTGHIYLTGNGAYGKGYVQKRDMGTGNLLWEKNFTYSTSSLNIFVNCTNVAIDGAGSVFAIGQFYGTTTFNPAPNLVQMTAAGDYDVFIVKIDSSENFIWAKQLGNTYRDEIQSIEIDNTNNIYCSGLYSGTCDFDLGTGTFFMSASTTSFIDKDAFILKLTSSGNFIWVRQFYGVYTWKPCLLTLDPSAHLLLTGTYYSSGADFDPGPAVYHLPSGNEVNGIAFVSKLDSSGNFIWAKKLGYATYAASICSDKFGNVFTAGSFQSTDDFDPGSGVYTLTTAGSLDGYISKLNQTGNFEWAVSIGGVSGDEINSIVVSDSGKVMAAGEFNGTADFDPTAGTYFLNPTAGTFDAFVFKVHECTTSPAAYITPAGPLSFCSGDQVLLNANTTDVFSYQWKKNGVIISGATASSYSPTTSGNYQVEENNFCGTSVSSVISVTVNSLPSATITPSGPTSFCSGESVILNAPVTSNRSYQWKKGANLISGATLSSYTATTGGNYRVIVTNTVTGCSKTTGSATVVTVNALPTATITPQGPTTFCAGGSVVLAANTGAGLTYKWKKGSNFISGVTLSNYTATLGGTYRVEVTNSNGCPKLSAGVTITVPCKIDGSESVPIAIRIDVQVYPNPSSGDFVFEIQNENAKKVSISIYDVIGRMISSDDMFDSQFTIYNSQLTPGIYSAVVIQGEYKKVIRLVKNP